MVLLGALFPALQALYYTRVSTSDRRNVKAVPLSSIRVCVADHGVLLTVPMLAPALLRK